jgi:hypothetical protein
MTSIDRTDCWALMRYINGALITCGWYGSPRDAMSRCPQVGRWIEVDHRLWRSEDGRSLIDCRSEPQRQQDTAAEKARAA